MAVSAGGVTLAALGGLAIWSGLANSSPLHTLTSLFAGQPVTIGTPGGPTLVDAGASGASGANTNAGGVGPAGLVVPGVSNVGTLILAATNQFQNDKYSETLRNEPGYSDCSSFVSKCMIAAGIAHPCGWNGGNYPTTLSFGAWSALKGVTDGTAAPGDILLSPGSHIALVIDANNAIGQENSSVNVRTGSWSSIMAGTGMYGHYRLDTEAL